MWQTVTLLTATAQQILNNKQPAGSHQQATNRLAAHFVPPCVPERACCDTPAPCCNHSSKCYTLFDNITAQATPLSTTPRCATSHAKPLTHHTAGGETYGKAQLQQFADQQTIHRLSTSGTTHQLISLWRCLNNCKHSAVQQSEVAAVVSRLLCHQVGTSKVPIHTLPQYHSDIRQVQHARSCKSYSGNRLLLIQSGREPHSFLQTTPVYCASNTTLFYI